MARFKEESRYRNATVTQVEYGGELRDYVVLRKPIKVPETDEDFYITLDQANAFRPDVISNQVYDRVDFAWAIMEVNQIRSFVELKPGIRLRIPPLDVIVAAIPESNRVT